jgi:hypothetical protein
MRILTVALSLLSDIQITTEVRVFVYLQFSTASSNSGKSSRVRVGSMSDSMVSL